MTRRHQSEFILLAAIWGASFLFIRVAVPEFGPIPLMLVRCAVGAAVLLPIAWIRHRGARLAAETGRHGGRMLLGGILSSVIPFVMFGFAGLWLTAGFSSILNATTPIFGAIVGYFWLRDRLTGWRIAGLAIGIAGVVLISWDKASFREGDGGGWAILACLVATFTYGVAGNFAKKHLAGINPLIVAAGSQVAATLVLLPPGIALWPGQMPSGAAWFSALAIGAVCTGLAYVIFFRLIANVSTTAALSVTFLIPLFGLIWGWLFLSERVDRSMLVGGAVILVGTALANGAWRPGGVRVGVGKKGETSRRPG